MKSLTEVGVLAVKSDRAFFSVMRGVLLFTCSAFLLAGQVQACLLYTSPSPRDGLLSRMPSSA